MILYLHGFCSSPHSHKALALKARMKCLGRGTEFACPALSHVPKVAISQAETLIEQSGKAVTLVGSSLGGYYATWLADRHDLRAVLVNPAVLAPLTLSEFLGPQTNFHSGECFDFTAEHVEQLRRLDVPRLSDPARFWVLLEQGDEVLDYRHAVTRYAGARQTVLPGGGHGFTRWESYLDDVIRFAVQP